MLPPVLPLGHKSLSIAKHRHYCCSQQSAVVCIQKPPLLLNVVGPPHIQGCTIWVEVAFTMPRRAL